MSGRHEAVTADWQPRAGEKVLLTVEVDWDGAWAAPSKQTTFYGMPVRSVAPLPSEPFVPKPGQWCRDARGGRWFTYGDPGDLMLLPSTSLTVQPLRIIARDRGPLGPDADEQP